MQSVTYTAKQRLAKEYEEILGDELNVKSVKFGDKLEFDQEITAELKKEGLARELERAVQEIRKSQGFKVGELAVLSYNTDDKEIETAFGQFDTKKTYIKDIKADKKLIGHPIEIDGKKLILKLG